LDGLVFSSGQKYIFLHYSINYLKSYFWWMFEYFENLISVIFFSQKKGFPSKWVIHLLFNSAPRKFKKLRNWCFYCVKTLSNFNLV